MSTQTLPQPRTAGLAARAGKVTCVAVSLLLFAQAGVLALSAVGSAIMAITDGTSMEVGYPAWAGAVFSLSLFGAEAAVSLVAGVALWQIAWGREERVGPRKTACLWASVAITALALSGADITVAAFAPSSDGLTWAYAAGDLVICGSVAASVAIFAMRSPLRWTGWRPVVAAVACSAVLVAGFAFMLHAEREAFLRSIRNDAGPPFGSQSAEFCGEQPNETCATGAAEARGGPVAWLTPPPGYQSELGSSTIVVHGNRAHEAIRSTHDGSRLLLASHAVAGVSWYCRGGDCTHHRTVRVDGRPVRVLWGFTKESGDFAVATWTHDGVRFELDAENQYHPVDQDWLMEQLRAVRYSYPSDPGTF